MGENFFPAMENRADMKSMNVSGDGDGDGNGEYNPHFQPTLLPSLNGLNCKLICTMTFVDDRKACMPSRTPSVAPFFCFFWFGVWDFKMLKLRSFREICLHE